MIKKLNSGFSHFKSFMGKYDIIFMVSILVVFVFFNTLKTYDDYGFYDYVYDTITGGVGVSIFFIIFTYINNKLLKKLNNTCEILPRFEDKKAYFKYTIKKMFNYNLFIYATFLVVTIVILMFKSSDFGANYYSSNIPQYIYVIFFIVRYFSILFILSVISAYIYRTFKNNVFLAIPIIIVALPYFFLLYTDEQVNSIMEMKLLYFDYLKFTKYSSFALEISLSLLYILILIGILLIIINISTKRSIGD